MTATPPTPPPAVVPAVHGPLAYAKAYVAAGYSIIPIARNGTKSPAIDRLPNHPDPKRPDRFTRQWTPFQIEIAAQTAIEHWFADGQCGVAIVGGAISGGLCCLDVESSAVAAELQVLLDELRPGLWARLPKVRTPGAHSTDGGLHLYFRVADLSAMPNNTLARKPGPNGKPVGIIEVRNEGKYWLAPGCPPDCHPLNKPYVWDSTTPKLTQAPVIDGEDALAIIGCARSLDRAATDAPQSQPVSSPAKPHSERSGVTPIDDYDKRGPGWSDVELLGGLGWKEVRKGYWRSPDKTNPGGWSASTTSRSEKGDELLHAFSSNAAPFVQNQTYGRGRAYAQIHHKGDLSAASKELSTKGYGDGSTSVPVRFGSASGVDGRPVAGGGGPAGSPEPSAEPEPWQSPLPLDTLAEPAPIFPLSVYPDWMRRTMTGIAQAIPCPVDYPAAFALGIASGMIGASLALKIKGKWSEVPSLYICAIGEPGSGKSPALKSTLDPVVGMHIAATGRAEPPIYVSDITTEKLATLLKDTPRGMLLARDELTGWIHSLDQYKAKGSGADRQFFLSAWSGDPINQLRKSPDSPPVFVPHPCLSVVGGTQPDVVAAFRGHNDGFSDRILFVYPELVRATEERWTTAADEDLDRWKAAVEILRQIPMTVDAPKPARPWLLNLDAGGKKEWERFYRWVVEQQNDRETPDYLIQPIQKLTNYVPRFAVVLHVLRHLNIGLDVSEIMEPRSLPPVGEEAMAGAAALARYFLDHAARAYGAMRADPRTSLIRKIVGWLSDKKLKSFTRRDVHRSMRRNVDSIDDWREPLKLLIQLGYLRYQTDLRQSNNRSGGPVYEVNPELKPDLLMDEEPNQ